MVLLLTLEVAGDERLVADDLAVGSADKEGCYVLPSFCRCIAALVCLALGHTSLWLRHGVVDTRVNSDTCDVLADAWPMCFRDEQTQTQILGSE